MSRWKSSFAASLVINLAIFAGGAIYMNYAAPEADIRRDPIEMEIVSDTDVPNAGPQISAPKPEKVEIPPPPTPEEVRQMTTDNGIPINEKIDDTKKQETPRPPTPAPANTTGNTTPSPQFRDNGGGGGGGSQSTPKEDKSSGPRRLSTPAPSIPRIPSGQAVSDVVVASITIGTDGSVSDVSLIQSSGYGPADSAILSAVQGWSFYPATDEDGNPIEAVVTQRFPLEIN